MKTYVYIYIYIYIYIYMTISRSISLRMRNVSDRKSKHTFYVQQLYPKDHVVYEVKWKNMVQPDRT